MAALYTAPPGSAVGQSICGAVNRDADRLGLWPCAELAGHDGSHLFVALTPAERLAERAAVYGAHVLGCGVCNAERERPGCPEGERLLGRVGAACVLLARAARWRVT